MKYKSNIVDDFIAILLVSSMVVCTGYLLLQFIWGLFQ